MDQIKPLELIQNKVANTAAAKAAEYLRLDAPSSPSSENSSRGATTSAVSQIVPL